MSAIFGIFNLDGKPVSQQTLDAMKNAMDYWGPDGSGTWCEGNVGLGQLMLHNTPESLNETLPFTSPDGLVITAGARIDNRDELFEALSVPHPERRAMPDSHLILKAYQKWGEDCPDRLLGDWAFAIWNPRQRKLFIARDHHGNTGLYYHHNSRFFVFASCLKGLFALPEIPRRPNALTIAQTLVAWPAGGPSTHYEDLFRLPPAHAMTVDVENIRDRQYWHLEEVGELRLGSDDEYVEAFLDLFREAVQCRLRSVRPVGVTLSGGLDSGSVAALAAHQLKERGETLYAFCSVPMYDVKGLTSPHRFGDERPFIEATCQFVGNIDPNYIDAADISPLAGIEFGLHLHDEPLHGAGNYHWIYALMQAGEQGNIGTLLTGQGGNATISWGTGTNSSLLSYLKAGEWNAFRQALRTRRQKNPQFLWEGVKRRMIHPVFYSVPNFAKRKEPWGGYAAINVEFAWSLQLPHRMTEAGHDPTFTREPNSPEMRYAMIRPGRDIGGQIWFILSAGFRMEIRDSTLDKRLLCFCLGVPDEQFVRQNQDRYLIRRAMAGILPPKVCLNTLRGRQAADVGLRVLQTQNEIITALKSLEASDLANQYLNLPVMWQTLTALQNRADASTTEQAKVILLRGLMVGLFLKRFE